jgi:hypothetical protein
MFRTAITPTSFNAAESGAWRDFDDRAEREDQIGAGLAGALAEPGF